MSANHVTLLLVDKGYYDFDYEVAKKQVLYDDTVKDKEGTNRLLSKFGLKSNTDLSIEELQEKAMNEIQ